MITLPSLAQLDRAAGTRIWLCTGPTDMRRGFGRLAEQAQQVTRQDPQAYLTQLLASLPDTPVSQLDQWLPHEWAKSHATPPSGAAPTE